MSVEIIDGLASGESVLLRRPAAGEVVAEISTLDGEESGMKWTGGRPAELDRRQGAGKPTKAPSSARIPGQAKNESARDSTAPGVSKPKANSAQIPIESPAGDATPATATN